MIKKRISDFQNLSAEIIFIINKALQGISRLKCFKCSPIRIKAMSIRWAWLPLPCSRGVRCLRAGITSRYWLRTSKEWWISQNCKTLKLRSKIWGWSSACWIRIRRCVPVVKRLWRCWTMAKNSAQFHQIRI